jgi:hypothetical protein
VLVAVDVAAPPAVVGVAVGPHAGHHLGVLIP